MQIQKGGRCAISITMAMALLARSETQITVSATVQ